MKYIIDKIKEALTQNDLLESLRDEGLIAVASYPIAIIHDQSRLEDKTPSPLFVTGTQSDTKQDIQKLQTIHDTQPDLLQTASIALLKEERNTLVFANKYPKDYWKKITDVSHIDAIVELTTCDEDICICESALREIIRKRKEVHALKGIGFIWILSTKERNDYSLLLSHYFGDDFTIVETEETTHYIGWSDTLKAINMRYFVCPPS